MNTITSLKRFGEFLISTKTNAPKTLIDVGCAQFDWTKDYLSIFPDTYVHGIEANPIHTPKLIDFASRYPLSSSYTLAACDKKNGGTIFFDITDPWGGSVSLTPNSHDNFTTLIPVVSLQEEIKTFELQSDIFLKLDTHGNEMAIIDGLGSQLDKVKYIFVEIYNFRLQNKGPYFWEICAYLQKKNFRLFDLTELSYRQYDGALWQMDGLFIKDSFDNFRYTEYK